MSHVDISGPQNRTAVTDATGEAHFLNLAPGTYTVSAKLTGFTDYLNKNVNVGTGASVPLKIAHVDRRRATQVQVTGETPVVDTKKMTTSTNVSVEELQNIPSSRDPWVVMQTVPGIIVDRVNVGGAESGQQSYYQAKGASGGENTWNMDGVAITDMAALGSHTDLLRLRHVPGNAGHDRRRGRQSATPGVQLNMVLKSGSNTLHGLAHLLRERGPAGEQHVARTVGVDRGHGRQG